MSSTEAKAAQAELAEHVARLYELADRALLQDAPSAIEDETIQRLVTLGVKLYVAKREGGHDFSPFFGESVTATETAVTSMGMLKAVNLDVFELSLWGGWGKV